jgi:hypothetical protein
VFDCANSCLFFPGDAKFSNAIKSFICFHFDKEIVARAIKDGDGFDGGDFHRGITFQDNLKFGFVERPDILLRVQSKQSHCIWCQ